MIIYGYRSIDHGQYEIEKGAVPETSSSKKLVVQIAQKYATLFFVIPIFPMPKEATVIIEEEVKADDGQEESQPSDTPGFKVLKKKEQSEELKAKIKELKSTRKTPIWTWASVIGFGLFVVGSFLLSLLGPSKIEKQTEQLANISANDYIIKSNLKTSGRT